MNLSAPEILRKLGAGESIAQVCTAAAISRAEFDVWWQAELRSREPKASGNRSAKIQGRVDIERDQRGIPHIFAANDADLFFGFGYALAQDRLFQIDYLRRRGSGRLAEILGPEGTDLDLLGRIAGFRSVLELDILARTVGLRRIAEAELTSLSPENQKLLTAFSNGINALMQETQGNLPIEFDLLGYRPEPWSPVDCLTIETEFGWYLTGRFPVIAIPELAKRKLGDGPLFKAFLQVEDDAESILPPGSYPSTRSGSQPVGIAAGDPEGAQGSNNWVIAGSRTNTGKPLVASDPHIAFDAVSCWYEIHLCGGSFNVAGATYAGMPAVLFGRTEKVAWGCTNNICSQRDLYQEKTDPAHPNCYQYDGRWEPAREREEVIKIKGGEAVRKTIRSSRNGPIVSEILPPAARETGTVSLRWVGASRGGWLAALLGMNRAKNAAEFREAMRPWQVPTFSVVYADTDGKVGYQSTGRVPIRDVWERGYRPGWDPAHQWKGLIPFEGMPHVCDPERGWMATANNRPAPNDFPYPLSGTWSEGMRARRIREMIEARPKLTRDDCSVMHLDAVSPRAVRCLPGLLKVLAGNQEKPIQEAVKHLQGWDGRMEPDRVGATLFEVFFSRWTRTVVAERFDEATAGFVVGGVNGLSAALLLEDAAGWFASGREAAILRTMKTALDWLTTRLGPDMSQWNWGRLHILTLAHILSGCGDLGTLLDQRGIPVPGNAHTVCNTGVGADFEGRMGAGYRLVADLSSSPPVLWSVDAQSQSGHPSSATYADQLPTWAKGEYYTLPLDRAEASRSVASKLTLQPG
ncbi:MAG: penicillin acylase family protein [Planctomycetes bacterium]|nr:penicillin acylase family protein [Planctomycetota bacterium]